MRKELDSEGRIVLQKPRSSSIYCAYTGRNISPDEYGVTLRMKRFRKEQYTINWVSISGLSSVIKEMNELRKQEIDFTEYSYNTKTLQNGVRLSKPNGTRYTCVCCGNRIVDSDVKEAYYFADEDLNSKVFVHNRYKCIRQLEDHLDTIKSMSGEILTKII